jgi:hypothetical protein
MRDILLPLLLVAVRVLDGAQAADQRLQMPGRTVPGRLDQILDEPVLAVVGEQGDRPHLRIGQPPGPHGRSKLREAGQRPRHPHMLDRGPMRQAAVVPEPAGRRRQPERRAALAGVEPGNQQQPPTPRRGQAAGQGNDLRP